MVYPRHAKHRVKGVQIHRPFVYGSTATPFDPSQPRPSGIPAEHTHRWTVFIRPLTPDQDLTHWLKKVQFKLHETYANSSRMIESPGPFEVTETGWGEFEVQLKLFFVPEANEKSQTLWHGLKLHPFGPDAERQRLERATIVSQNYEEVLFTEPVEAFFEVLTSNPSMMGGRGSKGAKGAKQSSLAMSRRQGTERTAEVPVKDSKENPYSQEKEMAEVARLREAYKKVEAMIKQEKGILAEKEKKREELGKESEG
ncbi:MAG: hypothetical protein Q9164_006090 [Protoblastenia rupestris]